MAAFSVSRLLQSLAIRPAKKLGQNFLCDANIARKSVNLLAIGAGDRVVEIGPGLGALTEQLLLAGAEVHAIELDRRLFDFLRVGLVKQFPGKISLLCGDAVALPRADLPTGDRGPYHVAANLPYAITSPWFDALLQLPLPKSMVLLLQREAVERLLTPEHSRRRGSIGIRAGAAFQMGPLHPVSPSCFYPQPHVESALITLRLRENPLIFPPKACAVMRHCFQRRRKQLRVAIGSIGQPDTRRLAERWLDALGAAGADSRARPEELSSAGWQLLESCAAASQNDEKQLADND
jgi:16S rRNA (adenine1518-N6/adenine1519-N6)-dimethyltransferase